MVMTILAKVEVEQSSFQKSIWQFYVRMGHLRICLEKGGQNLEVSVGLTVDEGDWNGDTCRTLREAKEIDVRARSDASALQTMSSALYAQMRL